MIGGGFGSRGFGGGGGFGSRGFGDRSGRMRLSMQERRPLKTSPWKLLRRLGGIVARYRLQLGLSLACVLITSAIQLLMPWAFKHVIDSTIPRGDVRELVAIGLGLVAAQGLRQLLSFYESYQVTLISQQIVYQLARDLFEHLQKLSLRFFERWGTGEIISRTTNDIGVLQQAVSGGTVRAAISTVNMVGFAVLMGLLNWQLALLAYLTVPVLYVAGGITAGKLRVRYRQVQERMAEVNNVLQENISGVRVARAFAREQDQRRRFHAENRGTLQANLSTAGVQAVATPAIQMISALGTAVILLLGSWQIVNGQLTVGTLVAFVTYLVQFYQPVEDLFRVNNTIQQALSAAERIFEFLDARSDVTEKPGALDLKEAAGAVAFEDVTFAYEPEKPVLHGLSLSASPGEIVALVGHTGSGKTTTVNLIPRLYDPDSGRVTLDGHDLSDLTLASLRRHTAVVLQETFLFGMSVGDNIRYGRLDATPEELVAAARQAHAHEFITELPEGYDTWCGEGGVLLSRGQRQRIALARAILKDPRILILDEATSDVDTQTEVLIQQALETVMRGRTTFVIAHRLSTIRHAGQILVLDHGRLVEQGTHAELLARGGHYRELYDAQFASQEAAQERIDRLAELATHAGQ
ncbi:MAG TPA: ABC transporter ATP-binding protein [Chloroflexota bacterium]|nr:ABC transporter ATP-binding protein [Chloroflexota bacterium]